MRKTAGDDVGEALWEEKLLFSGVAASERPAFGSQLKAAGSLTNNARCRIQAMHRLNLRPELFYIQ